VSGLEKALTDLAREGVKTFFETAKAAFMADLEAQKQAFTHQLKMQEEQVKAYTEGLKSGRRKPPGRSRLEVAYRYLGVKPNDPDELVKAVYRAKSKVLHPDNSETGNEAAFKKLNGAYEIVMEDRRKKNGGK
jgi:DnaJ-class molecular chaperone